ncbi:hypothetical protein Bca4012_037052 [Brassica carinata]
MSNRLSRSEKEKWVSNTSRQHRRPTVVIPEPDNNDLIEANKLTLIGRVTNPTIQKTRALVDFFLQHWSVVGHFTGRDLGPHLFQFRFESERDLQSVLNKAPYHFKRWMIILQRWEPVISDDFPSSISFRVRVHGIPLHYWNEKALEAIGSELGEVENKDVDQGRVRVQSNGLKALVMIMDLSLPSGGTKEVELEYEYLQKHCFLCMSLSHEQEACPQKRSSRPSNSEVRGINHSNTLESLDSYKRAKDDKKLERGRHAGSQRRAIDPRPRYHSREEEHRAQRRDKQRSPLRSSNYRVQYSREASYNSQDPQNRISHQLVGDSRGAGSKNKSVDLPEGGPSQRIPASRRLSQGHGSVHARLGERVWVEKGSLTQSQTQSQVSHTPPPRPPREGIAGSLEVTSSTERRSALERLALSNKQLLLQDGDGTDTHEGPSSQTRISALQRLAPPPLSERTPLVQNGEPNSESVKERLSLPQDSPIRTLSEDRRHLTASCLVIHSPVATEEPVQEGQHNTRSATKRKSAAAKASGKRKASDNPTSRKKVVRSPLHGVSLKKRRVSKAQNSPRRKLYDESPAPGEKAAVPPAGLSGGLLLSWQDHVELEILDSSPNFIDVKVVTGDFNELLDNSEKVGGPVRWEGSFIAFRSFVTQAGLWDLQHTGNQLSWRGTREMSEQDVVTLALKEARIWQAAQKETNSKTKPSGKERSHLRLEARQATQVFVDAAWNATTGGGGFGCIFKDQSHEETFHQISSNRCFVGSALVAEALAVKTALLEAVSLGLRTLTVWSDSQSLITVISSRGNIVEAQGVLFDIYHLCNLFTSISFHHVPRLNNTEADALAKYALQNIVISA